MSDALKNLKFTVDMTCEGCSGAVERVLGKHKDKGVESFTIDLPNKLVSVSSSLTPEEVGDIIKKTGKTTQYLGEMK